MVYAVCSTTYAAFRHALGRDLAWGFTRRADGNERLIIRPAVDDLRNAFYDRDSGELRFGQYTADAKVFGLNLPRGRVSTCLSHDVVVHETTHALLDGLRSHFSTPTNSDVMAFHEAFADLVAIFQRFTYKDVVAAGIGQSRGDVRCTELLTSLALQFGQTIGLTGGLRNAVAGTDRRYGDSDEPHRRGEVLVAAVFDAFASIYERKTSRLVRLATQGTGTLPSGAIPVELADALTERACKLASQFLSICIRAIDYCPPVDITFGEYLRAMITADYELVPDDDLGYREALIEGFRKYDIFPNDVTNLSEDALLWRASDQPIPPEPELAFDKLQFSGDPARPAGEAELVRQARALGGLVADPQYAMAFGLCPDSNIEGDTLDLPVIHSIRSARRVGPDGQVVFDLVAEVTQRRQVRAHAGISGFDFYGGSTVVLDPVGTVRYVIRKSLSANDRLARQRAMIASGSQFWGVGPSNRMYPEQNAFRLLHATLPREADRRRKPLY
jgi:hypothetical protein